jgi:hypothetical protein
MDVLQKQYFYLHGRSWPRLIRNQQKIAGAYFCATAFPKLPSIQIVYLAVDSVAMVNRQLALREMPAMPPEVNPIEDSIYLGLDSGGFLSTPIPLP